jgi:hypothetical protein
LIQQLLLFLHLVHLAGNIPHHQFHLYTYPNSLSLKQLIALEHFRLWLMTVIADSLNHFEFYPPFE